MAIKLHSRADILIRGSVMLLAKSRRPDVTAPIRASIGRTSCTGAGMGTRWVAGGCGETRGPGAVGVAGFPPAATCSLLGRTFIRSGPVRKSSFIPIRGPRVEN